MKRLYIVISAIVLISLTQPSYAQMGKKEYFNAGWQFNWTAGNPFVDSAQGYGAYFEGGYYITPSFALGGFVSFNTNDEYIPKKTYLFENMSALTTDLDRSLFQVPFGLSMRTRFLRSQLQPYLGTMIGTEYSTQSTYMSTFVDHHQTWGFYMSTEIGLTYFPFRKNDLGVQLAVYYSWCTNENDAYDIEGMNNLGFKLGLAF